MSFLTEILLNPFTAVLLVLSCPKLPPHHPQVSCSQKQEDTEQAIVPLFNLPTDQQSILDDMLQPCLISTPEYSFQLASSASGEILKHLPLKKSNSQIWLKLVKRLRKNWVWGGQKEMVQAPSSVPEGARLRTHSVWDPAETECCFSFCNHIKREKGAGTYL